MYSPWRDVEPLQWQQCSGRIRGAGGGLRLRVRRNPLWKEGPALRDFGIQKAAMKV